MIAATGAGATVTQLNTFATAFAISVQEMQNIGTVAYIQANLTAQATSIQAYDPSQSNVSALLAKAQKLAPYQYAAIQQAVQQVDSKSKAAIVSPNGLMTALSGLGNGLQALISHLASTGGTLQVATSKRRPAPHVEDIYCMVPTRYVVGIFLLAGIFAPEVEIGVFLGATIEAGDVFNGFAALYGMIGNPGC
ncbi:MAG: hypothetical protein ACYDC6_04890 [Acidobacteriaceae bacterium]